MLNSNYTHISLQLFLGDMRTLYLSLTIIEKKQSNITNEFRLLMSKSLPLFTPRHLHAVGGYNIATSNKHGPRQMCLLQLVHAVGK